MIVFLRLLPFVLLTKLGINPEDETMQFIIELCDVVKIVLAPVIFI